MTRAEYLAARSRARYARRALALLPPAPMSTWQDKDRLQDGLREAVMRLPERAVTRAYGFIDAQTRRPLERQFPRWAARRNQLRERRQKAATRARIEAFVSHLGPSTVEQNIAAQAARSAT